MNKNYTLIPNLILFRSKITCLFLSVSILSGIEKTFLFDFKRVSFFLLCLFFGITIYGQDLDETYINKLKEYTSTNNDSLLFYANKLKNSNDM